jgi:surface polysaccharide O-acyltransferase-like enzyme
LATQAAAAIRPMVGTDSRRQRVDAFRVYAILLIVWGHVQILTTVGGGGPIAKTIEFVFAIGARFTIPYFFILAGYFTGAKIAQDSTKAWAIARAYTARLAVIFLFWSFIYALEQPQAFLDLARNQPLTLLFEGPRLHLWFLVSLMLTVWLFVLWPIRNSLWTFLILGGILYCIGLLGGSYHSTPIGFDMHFNTRNGVFFSTLFFAIGVALRTRMPRVSKKMALGIALSGLVIYSFEALYLRLSCGASPSCHDYLLGTVPFGIGVALFALAQPDSNLDNRVGPYGQYTLGVYVCHLLFMDLLLPVGRLIPSLIWRLVMPGVIYILSLLTTVLLAKTFLRRVVI